MPSAGLSQLKAALSRVAVLAGIWAGLVGLLLAVGVVVIHSAAITHFDEHITAVVVDSRTPALNSAMKAVTWLGSWVALVVAAGVIALLVLTRRLPMLAFIAAVFAWAGETGGIQIGKHVLGRDRPPEAIRLVRTLGWSFPSGHTAAACLAFMALAWCLATLAPHRAVRILGWLVAGLAIAATAFSRVELGAHWTTDVIASVVFVTSWLTAITVLLGGRLRQPGIGDGLGPSVLRAPALRRNHDHQAHRGAARRRRNRCTHCDRSDGFRGRGTAQPVGGLIGVLPSDQPIQLPSRRYSSSSSPTSRA